MAKGRDPHEGRRHSAPPSEPERVTDKEAQRRGVEMARVMANPVRFQILIDMNTPTRRLSAKQWSDEQPEPITNAGYHFRVLEKAGCIQLHKTIKKRGAEERIHEPVKRAMAWHEEWANLGPFVRQLVASSASPSTRKPRRSGASFL